MKGIWDRAVRGIIVWSALALSACVTTSRPPVVTPAPPAFTERTLAVHVHGAAAPIAGCHVELSLPLSGKFAGDTDGNGYAAWLVRIPKPDPGGGLNARIAIACEGFRPLEDSFVIAATGNQDITFGGSAAGGNQPMLRPGPAPAAPPITPRPRLHIEGHRFVTPDGQTVWPVLASELSVLRRSDAERDADLEQWAGLGFDGVRTFAGALTWANQSPMLARAALPDLLTAASAKGLIVFASMVTDSGIGYDIAAHLRDEARILDRFDNALAEAGNEPWHPSQADDVRDLEKFCQIAREAFAGTSVPWALGAAEADEPDTAGIYPANCGPFSTAHLDRSRDLLNQVRRVREIRAIRDAIGKPVGNTEPLGAAEFDQPGRRTDKPWWFYILAVLNRCFGVVGVFHSEDGLNARPLGPIQLESARNFVAGSRVIPTSAELDYRNVGWSNGCLAKADFTDTGGPIVRAYCFVEPGDQVAYVVVIHVDAALSGAPLAWANDWRPAEVIGHRDHVTVYRAVRGGAIH